MTKSSSLFLFMCAAAIFLGAWSVVMADPLSDKLEEPELLAVLSGATLYGRYEDGRPDWAEQTAATGQLYDVTDEWREVGSWTIIADMACYKYFDTGRVSCFDVYREGDEYLFYSPGTDHLVAPNHTGRWPRIDVSSAHFMAAHDRPKTRFAG